MRIYDRYKRACGGMLVLCALGVSSVSLVAQPADAPVATEEKQPTPAQAIEAEANQIIQALAETGDWKSLHDSSGLLMERAFRELRVADTAALTQTAYAHRLTRYVGKATASDLWPELTPEQAKAKAREFTALLNQYPQAGRRLMFMFSDRDDSAWALTMFSKIAEKFGDDVEDYANLTAAICVVHDQEFQRRINENMTSAPSPLELFAYFTKYERKMTFGIRNVPAELLVYVVDSTASIREMQWALNEYRNTPLVGRLFFTIDYDYPHYLYGRPKVVTVKGFSLPNIKRYGGVCADQAYFAMTVGKSIGIPTTYTVGRGAEVGHAWVGYFRQDRKRTAMWDFSEGRYPSYQGVAGVIQNPQTGLPLGDGVVALQAKLLGSSSADREVTTAAADVSQIVMKNLVESTADMKPTQTPRPLTAAAVLDWIEDGLRVSPGVRQGWEVVSELASKGQLSLEEKRKWAGLVQKLCGDECPDFSFEMLEPMIVTVDDPKVQDKLWQGLAKSMGRRRDLMARAGMKRAEMWRQAQEPGRAAACYQGIIKDHANDGPFVFEAVRALEQMLVEKKSEAGILQLYEFAWSQCELPRRTAFANQSNYYRLGRTYAQLLNATGRTREANKVANAIAKVVVQ